MLRVLCAEVGNALGNDLEDAVQSRWLPEIVVPDPLTLFVYLFFFVQRCHEVRTVGIGAREVVEPPIQRLMV